MQFSFLTQAHVQDIRPQQTSSPINNRRAQ